MSKQSLSPHDSFELLQQRPLPALGLEAAEYLHHATGARHLHLAAKMPENVFLVALRTVPADSTGVAHILEHTVLCGSERYPVRDPFFMMLRRSLSTFMNAFTASDWTAYPFATRNRKDFDNLLGVYLDAVFFPRLDPLDFAQEGHRIEHEEADNSETPLVYRGVVYNEMKGAMSSPPSQVWQTLARHLHPTTTYRHNSGGDPAAIPELSHEALRAFHRRHYHPGNAIFMTYGDIPVQAHQGRFEEEVLGRFHAAEKTIAVPLENRYQEPLTAEDRYTLSTEEETKARTHHLMAWLLDSSSSPELLGRAQLLAGILMDNSASPLLKALETSALGTAPSSLCGLEDGHREMIFTCGLEGSEPERAQDFEALVLGTLNRIAEEGVPREQAEAVLHQFELRRREVGGDGFPYGLQLLISCLPTALHRGDALAMLDPEPVLEKLRREIQEPSFVPGLVRELLLDNPHRLRLTMRPDPAMDERRQEQEKKRLAALCESLDGEGHRQLAEQAQALAQRQQQKDDPEILPRLQLQDVPAEMPEVAPAKPMAKIGSLPTERYTCGTNGLVYQQLVADLPMLSDEQQELLPLYTFFLPEVGVNGMDYLAAQQRQAQVSGGISARHSIRGRTDDEQEVRGCLVLASSALVRNQKEMSMLLRETIEQARFDELPRLRELLSLLRNRSEESMTAGGHRLAMSAAVSGMNSAAALAHRTGGLEGIRRLRALARLVEKPAELESLAERLQQLHRTLQGGLIRALLVAEEEHLAACEDGLTAQWPAKSGSAVSGLPPALCDSPLRLPKRREASGQLWRIESQVHFCARAWPTVAAAHPDAAPLAVLGHFLQNGYLHRAIREQGGAYGAGAQQNSSIAAFCCFSYRDPRLAETLEDFNQAVRWLVETKHEERQLEEAVLGVIAALDKPASPAGEAKRDFHEQLFGSTAAHRRTFRERVLKTSLEDLQRAGKEYLAPERASTAVIVPMGAKAKGCETLQEFSMAAAGTN